MLKGCSRGAAELRRLPHGPARRAAQRAQASAATQGAPSFWRLFNLSVAVPLDPGKDDVGVHGPLCEAIAGRLKCKEVQEGAVRVVRKAFDARRSPSFVYTVDLEASRLPPAVRARLRHQPGRCERWHKREAAERSPAGARPQHVSKAKVIVVGSGPGGLFAALELAEAGVQVVLLERGRPVEGRGRDIGALFVRRQLNPDSNLCYGEGGAGTWSDGKLTTRIGSASSAHDPVRAVLDTLCRFGAPEEILVAGKPHLGTDRLVRLLRSFRQHLAALGVDIRFDATVTELLVAGGRARGVQLAGGQQLAADRVVLAAGHSSRAMHGALLRAGARLSPKPFALGFRIEHPQALIDRIQYGPRLSQQVERGRGPVPVADYRLATQIAPEGPQLLPGGREPDQDREPQSRPVAAQPWEDAPFAGGSASAEGRSVYSFCMCPGGQVVPTSLTPDELCVNGMSFSRRNSLWANAALVVGVGPEDWAHHVAEHGVLAGVALQVEAEREAARRGGGGLVAPVQRVTDFLAGAPSQGPLPSSSYRLGVRAAPLHDLYSGPVTAALRAALRRFDRVLPGFITPEALLHGVETRTSSPVRVDRGPGYESVSLPGLYPCGEGAGYAGGIVSAAVDGMKIGQAILCELGLAGPDERT